MANGDISTLMDLLTVSAPVQPQLDTGQIPDVARAVRNLPEFQRKEQTLNQLSQLLKTSAETPAPTAGGVLPGALAGLANFIRGGQLGVPQVEQPQTALTALGALSTIGQAEQQSINSILDALKIAGTASASAKRGQQIDKATERLGKELGKAKTVPIVGTLEEAGKVIGKKGELKSFGGGLSFFDEQSIALFEGAGLVQKGATRERAVLKGLEIFFRNPLFGSQLTEPETRQFNSAFGTLRFGTSEQRRAALADLTRLTRLDLKRLKGAFPPEAVARMAKRGGLDLKKLENKLHTLENEFLKKEKSTSQKSIPSEAEIERMSEEDPEALKKFVGE